MKEETENPAWDRLKEVIESTGMTVSAFAREIGLKRGENLYQIKRGNNGISHQLAITIHTRFPQFSIGWLLTGEKIDIPISYERIPLLSGSNIKFLTENLEIGKSENIYIDKKLVTEGCLAIINMDNSTKPIIPRGAMVILKADAGKFIPGKFYAVEFGGVLLIRKVRVTNNPDRYHLIPVDIDNFDELTVDVSEVGCMYRIEKVIYDI